MRQINIANYSKHIQPAELTAVVAALQIQVSRDFNQWWGIDAKLVVSTARPIGEALYLVDTDTIPDALGYHTLSQNDVPYGVVQVDLDIQYGDQWSATLSHELLEMLLDPWCTSCEVAPWQGIPLVVLSREVCDPVENAAYQINGVEVSDFVTPYWFQGGVVGAKYDHLGVLPHSLLLGVGGYQSWSADLKHWNQTFGETTPVHQRVVRQYSRKWKRFNRTKRGVV